MALQLCYKAIILWGLPKAAFTHYTGSKNISLFIPAFHATSRFYYFVFYIVFCAVCLGSGI